MMMVCDPKPTGLGWISWVPLPRSDVSAHSAATITCTFLTLFEHFAIYMHAMLNKFSVQCQSSCQGENVGDAFLLTRIAEPSPSLSQAG